MANLIQIKRSTTTATPGALANGELAYTSNGDVLFIGSAGSVVAVGGARNPGTLTANQALVANSTSYINEVKTTKLFLTDGTANVTHINATANSTVLGSASNTEITTTWAIKTYVDDKTSSLGGSITNTQIVYSDSGTLRGSSAFTFNNTTNTVSISGPLVSGNTTVTGFANISSTLAAGNTTVTGFANISSTLAAGNTTVTGFVNATGSGTFGTTLAAGNTTVTGFVNATGSGTFGTTLAAGNTTITGFANITSTLAAGNTIISGSANVTGTLNAGNGSISGDLTVSGNLLVSGDVVTINTTNLNIEDPLIRLANGNATTDAVDIGLWGTYGNATVTQSTGFFRDATDGVWKLFAGAIPDLSTATTVDTANVNFALANLQLFKLTANTVVASNAQITGGQITGIVDLTVADGGTGVSVFANNGIIYGQNTNALAVTAAGTEGQVLQAGAGGVPVFASLDGGTF